jgi:hypothetical protein
MILASADPVVNSGRMTGYQLHTDYAHSGSQVTSGMMVYHQLDYTGFHLMVNAETGGNYQVSDADVKDWNQPLVNGAFLCSAVVYSYSKIDFQVHSSYLVLGTVILDY